MNYEAIALWSQVVAAVLFAAIVIWMFYKFVTPAINAATAAKNEEIAARERRRDEAMKAVELARARIAEAESAASRIREAAIHDATRRSEKLLSEAWRDSERVVKNASHELERARLAARDRLRVELIEKALQRAQALARAQIDEHANRKLVDRFVAGLEDGTRR